VISSDENWDIINKYSAVAEMGDRFAIIDMGRKLGSCSPCRRGSWVRILHNVAQAEAYLHAKWHPDPCGCLAAIDKCRK